MSGIAGTAIVGGAGNEAVDNYGVVNGSIDLGAGANAFRNMATGTLNSGSLITIGAGNTIANAGTLSSGGFGHVQATTIAGNLSGAPTWQVDLGAAGASDSFAVSGRAQFDSSVTTLDVNALETPAAASVHARDRGWRTSRHAFPVRHLRRR